ncbi:MAG: hypothetical protein GKR77_04260 [Legionellales bacterium]|nr:hypothetical protein [Legionellales bacterium]
MARMGRFYHRVGNTAKITGVAAAYNALKRHEVTMGSFPEGAPWNGRLGSITIHLSGVAATDTLFFRITTDAAGDSMIVGETNAGVIGGTTTVGIATPTKATVIVNADFLTANKTNDKIYVWYKGAGAFDVEEVSITWEE